ncbi:MAG: tetratricopeptide repeat protein [Chloroflexi bacterium]|nr:tetratricopeptide repeat protein [Chloroflexota bacterium]
MGKPQTTNQLVILRQNLIEYFNTDELRSLCFDLGIDWESLAGEGKNAKARELITYMQRRGKLDELMKAVREVRPTVAWGPVTQEIGIEQDAIVVPGELVKDARIMIGQTAIQPDHISDGRVLITAPEKQIDFLNASGQQELGRGNFDAALDNFQRSLGIARHNGLKDPQAQLLSLIGNVYRARQQFNEALAHYQQSLSAYRDIGNLAGQAGTLVRIGNVLREQARYKEALAALDESLALTRQVGNRGDEASALLNLGNVLRSLGDPAGALSRYAEAEQIWRELGDVQSLALTLNESGFALLNFGDLPAAEQKLHEALALARQNGSDSDVAQILTNLAVIDTQRANWADAEARYQETLALYQSLRDRRGEFATLSSLGGLHASQQRWDQALKFYQQSWSTALRNDDLASVALALTNIGHATSQMGHADEALNWFQQALSYQQSLGDSAGIARTQDSINAIYAQRDEAKRPLMLVVAEAQRFFRAAGFKIATTGAGDSFICDPNTPLWKKKLKAPVYTSCLISRMLDGEHVLDLREAAQKAVPASTQAFVLVDQTPKDDAWSQILTLRLQAFNLMPISTSLLYESKAAGKANAESIALQRYLERFIGSGSDPYNVRDPVTDITNFYGREALAESLKDELAQNRPIGLFGLRKMGKSSLMRFMQQRMPCPTAWIDLQAGTELQGVYERIVRAWHNDIQARFNPLNLDLGNALIGTADPSGDFVKITTGALDAMAAEMAADVAAQIPDVRLAIFLDEIELILPPDNADAPTLARYLTLMRTLRGLVQEDGRVSFMVAGVDPAVNRRSRLGNEQNPFFQLLKEVFMPPLLTEDCVKMVRNIGAQVELSFDDETAAFVARASGGHPFFARQLCSLAYMLRQRQSGRVSMEELRAAAEKFMFDPQYAAIVNESGLWGEISNSNVWGEAIARSNQDVLLLLGKANDAQPEAALVNDIPAECHATAQQPQQANTRRSALYTLNNVYVVQRDQPGPATGSRYAILFGLFRNWIRQIRLGLDE